MWRTCGRTSRDKPRHCRTPPAPRPRLAERAAKSSPRSTTRMPRPPPPALAFNSNGKPMSGARRLGRIRRCVAVLGSGDDGNAGCGRSLARRDLVAHALNGVAVGSDESEACFACSARQRRRSRRESRSRDKWRRISERPRSRSGARVEIARFRRRRADADGVIGGSSDAANSRRPNCKPRRFRDRADGRRGWPAGRSHRDWRPKPGARANFRFSMGSNFGKARLPTNIPFFSL